MIFLTPFLVSLKNTSPCRSSHCPLPHRPLAASLPACSITPAVSQSAIVFTLSFLSLPSLRILANRPPAASQPAFSTSSTFTHPATVLPAVASQCAYSPPMPTHHPCLQAISSKPARLLGQELLVDKAATGHKGLSEDKDVGYCLGGAKIIYKVK